MIYDFLDQALQITGGRDVYVTTDDLEGTPPPRNECYLLQEDGGFLLQEDGGRLIIACEPPPPGQDVLAQRNLQAILQRNDEYILIREISTEPELVQRNLEPVLQRNGGKILLIETP